MADATPNGVRSWALALLWAKPVEGRSIRAQAFGLHRETWAPMLRPYCVTY
ncbi:MAG TPA: hypothetical protein IGS52_09495 [Oscillatoriaceae cyanobacterium M33_DOE_052]|nr:hypothetical protein [Oscillatoriaceae cyanobacterium M33_DOE_052]